MFNVRHIILTVYIVCKVTGANTAQAIIIIILAIYVYIKLCTSITSLFIIS